jgi:general L-amino acid transport system permease protein
VIPWLVQAVVGLVVLLLIAFLLGNLIRNLTAAGLLLTWRWLSQPAGFDLGETIVPFDAGMPYWRGLLAGLAGGGELVFIERITEGQPCCRACFTLAGSSSSAQSWQEQTK